MGRGGARCRACDRRPGADRGRSGGALPRRGRRRARGGGPRAPRRGGSRQLDRLSDAELAPRLEALYYLGWAENYLEYYEAALTRADRGVALARATGDGRLLVPMTLVQGYTLEMLGRMPEAIELCEAAVESTRLSGGPHDLSWALYELAYAHYFAGDLEAAIAAAEESAQIGGRMAGATMPAAGGGPGWVLGHGAASRPARSSARTR